MYRIKITPRNPYQVYYKMGVIIFLNFQYPNHNDTSENEGFTVILCSEQRAIKYMSFKKHTADVQLLTIVV
jgi:hypothetical protein